MKHFITSIFFYFLVHSIVFGQTIIRVNVPKATYSEKAPGENGDSVLFNIYMKNDSLQVSSYLEKKTIKNFQDIDDFCCETIKFKSSRSPAFLFEDYHILLFIDSLVPYQKVDQLLEELKILPYDKIFLCTNAYHYKNRGYDLDLKINSDEMQKIVAGLYGPTYSRLKYDEIPCYVYVPIVTSQDTNPPMPPPPPPIPSASQIPDLLDVCLKLKKVGSDTNYFFIGIDSGMLKVNKTPRDIDFLSKLILNKNSELFLIPGEKNTYKDLIKLIEYLHLGQQLAYEKESLISYKKRLVYLTNNEKYEVMHKHQLYYKILSLSEQIYLKKN